jgi:hypothetical protein
MGLDKKKYDKNGTEGSTPNKWATRVGYALRNINDRYTLNKSPLAKIAYVKELAKQQYNGHLLPNGLALRNILSGCVEKILDDLCNEPALQRECKYLELTRNSLSCNQISIEMGLSREHVSRVYRKNAMEILASQFLSTIRNHG